MKNSRTETYVWVLVCLYEWCLKHIVTSSNIGDSLWVNNLNLFNSQTMMLPPFKQTLDELPPLPHFRSWGGGISPRRYIVPFRLSLSKRVLCHRADSKRIIKRTWWHLLQIPQVQCWGYGACQSEGGRLWNPLHLYPLYYRLQDCVLEKISDDSAIVRLITNVNNANYRWVTQDSVDWCEQNGVGRPKRWRWTSADHELLRWEKKKTADKKAKNVSTPLSSNKLHTKHPDHFLLPNTRWQ